MRFASRWLVLVGGFSLLITTATAGWPASQRSQSPEAAPATPSQVDTWLAEADALRRGDKHQQAQAMYARAIDAARTLALPEQEAQALCGTGESSLGLARYDEAKTAGLRCLELSERIEYQPGIGRASIVLGNAADLMGNYADAAKYSERAVSAFEATGNRRGTAIALLLLARTSKDQRDDLMRRAVEESRASGDREVEARALHSWGDGLFSAGRYEESFEILESAARLFEAVGERIALGTVYNSLGRIYRAHGRLDEALRYQLKALEIHQAANAPFQLIQSTNAVAVVYGMRGDARKSREFYERALSLAEKTASPRIQDFLRANIAALLNDQGEFARAARVLEEVIAHKLDAYPGLRHSQLSYARLKMGQIPEALAAADRAVELCGTGTDECVNARARRAAAYSAAGNESAALEDLRAALAMIEEMRTRLVPADFFKQNFHRTQEYTYSQAIALQFSQQRQREALETAEKARARAFLDLLASRNVQTATPAATVDVVATAARLHSTFLLYWVAEDAVYVWAVSPNGQVESRKVNVLRSKLVELIRASTPQEEAPTTRAAHWRELYNLLIGPIRAALPREPGALLTVVSHGPLLTLSFAALQDSRGRYLLEDFTIHHVPAAAVLQHTANDRRPDVRAGEALLVADPPSLAQSRFERKLPRLPGARSEAAAIGRLLTRGRQTLLQGDAATEASIREGLRGKAIVHFATHAIVRDDAPFSSFLALGPGPLPRAPATRPASADGLLTAEEIYTLNLDAGLIVLSACRSGDGPVTGDGMATFARAFMSAGTPTLIASLWSVADEPTNRLVPAFYRAWLGGQSKAGALRTAQLELLRDLRAKKVRVETPVGVVPIPEHPVFWAGFSLIGEPN